MGIVNDNSDAVFAQLEAQQDAFLDALGQRGVTHLHERTPRRTGFLDSRNGWEMTGPGEGHWTNDADYAVHVELGHLTPSGAHVPANPYMQHAVDDTAAEGEQIAREHFTG